MYRFTHGMYYANAELLSQEVTRLAQEAKPPLVWFCLEASAMDDIDYTAAATLRSLHSFLQTKGIPLVFAGVSPKVQTELVQSQITDLVGRDAIYDNVALVIKDYRQKMGAAALPGTQE